MFALVDGNNFYVSCERVFAPRLAGRPVIVLSNNDGCAIARSNEARALGIRMGEPWFEVRQRLQGAGIIALSANFALYGEMSQRMMAIAAGLGPAQEIYSIDESFIDLAGMTGTPDKLTARCQRMRARLLQWIGLPCGIGVGTTKTLAKLANHVAKTADRQPGSYPAELGGVCNLAALPASDLDTVLSATDLKAVWGIGRRLGAQLREEGLTTVLDVARMDPAMVRRRWSVVLERTVRELQGQPCLQLESQAPPKQEIACTRSFGQPVTELADLSEAVSHFASRAACKLRAQASQAAQVLVFLHTSPFRRQDRQYSRSITVPLRRPSSDSRAIVQAAMHGLRLIFKAGYCYAKAGVMLLDLQDGRVEQHELALEDDAGKDDKRSALMRAMDRLNARYGPGTVSLASSGPPGASRIWSMRQAGRTPNYLASWTDLPRALA
ncbi:MAG: Y-family DNA polymerase [Polaromonas sp.]